MMTNPYDSLFRPIRIGNIEVKNRFLLAPMEGTAIIEWISPKGFQEEKKDFFIERADDGRAPVPYGQPGNHQA